MPDRCETCASPVPDRARTCPVCGAPLDGAAHPAVPPDRDDVLMPGTLLNQGGFSVGRVLGRGGFGITYLGADLRLNRTVAIKEFFPVGSSRRGARVVLPGGLDRSAYERMIDTFTHEARTVARFHHRAIVSVYGVFQENDSAYMVMEYLQGEPLLDRMERRGTPLEEAELLDLAAPVAEALEEIHAGGVLHRDIKPENIMLAGPEGATRPVLIDFGTARDFTTGTTQRHSIVVTPGYAPLEQYGEHTRRGPFTDIYAFAATLYHAATGAPPPTATDRVLGVTLKDPRALNPVLTPAFSQALLHGLEMNVNERPHSARTFYRELAGVATTGPSPRPSPPASSELSSRHLDMEELGTLSGHRAPVQSAVFSPDGRLLASGGADKTIKLWDMTARQVTATLKGHTAGVQSVAFSPGGRLLASGAGDGTIKLWDVAERQETAALTGRSPVRSVVFSPDRRLLASGNDDNTITIWDAATRSVWNLTLRQRMAILAGHTAGVQSVAFSPDGRLLATGSSDRTIKLWNMTPLQAAAPVRRILPLPRQAAPPLHQAIATLTGHTDQVHSVTFSPDGRLLVSAAGDGTIRIWDVTTGQAAATLTERHPAWCVAFSPNGRYLASGSGDGTIELWDISTRQVTATIRGHTSAVESVAFSPGGRLLASAGRDRTIKLWRSVP